MLDGLIAVGSLGGFWATRAATQGPDDAEVRTFGSSAAATVAARLDADGRLLLAAAEAVGGDPARSDDALTADLSRVAPAGQVMGIVRTSSTATATIAVAVPPQGAGTVIWPEPREPSGVAALARLRSPREWDATARSSSSKRSRCMGPPMFRLMSGRDATR